MLSFSLGNSRRRKEAASGSGNAIATRRKSLIAGPVTQKLLLGARGSRSAHIDPWCRALRTVAYLGAQKSLQIGHLKVEVFRSNLAHAMNLRR